MKKVLAVLLAAAMTISLVGCGGAGGEGNGAENKTEDVKTEAADVPGDRAAETSGRSPA